MGLLVKFRSISSALVVQAYGEILIKSLSDSSGWVIAEALDAIFGIFDDNYPEVVEKIGLISTLTKIFAFSYAKAKRWKRENRRFNIL